MFTLTTLTRRTIQTLFAALCLVLSLAAGSAAHAQTNDPAKGTSLSVLGAVLDTGAVTAGSALLVQQMMTILMVASLGAAALLMAAWTLAGLIQPSVARS
jgi:hypothetical protein